MARFVKDVLRPGVFLKGKTPYRFTPDDLNKAILNFEKMQKAGYRVPVIIEHAKPTDPEGLPCPASEMSARDRAKYQAGWADSMAINDQGVLQVAMSIKSDDGHRLIRDVGTFVSPQIGPWHHPGEEAPSSHTITHLALTPYPVDIGQNPEFREVPDSAPLAISQLSQLVNFSMADLIPEKPDLGDSDADDNGITDAPPTPPLADQMPDVNQQNTYAQISEALKMLGVILPDSVSHADNPEALLAALMTCAHHQNKAAADEAADMPAAPVPGQNPNVTDPRLQGTTQENQITMSQSNTASAAIASAATDVSKHPEFIQMSQTVAKLTEKTTALEREKYVARVSNLVKTGRITQAKADQFLASVQTYQFSLTGTSTDIVKLDAQLELAEELPAGAIWSPDERVKQLSMVEHQPGAFFSTNGNQMPNDELQRELERRFGVAPTR